LGPEEVGWPRHDACLDLQATNCITPRVLTRAAEARIY
jgi:hypothetical protein